ncbi:hypothetical protein J437_LFUL004435 [Ladona fulva]|uniref:Uncharacterized protein n=1 Tax=Ladona fulva TaxID=123851 RepID=A0A8K0K139_LADFU|nr:hypothetical protein J437_LFUL004435 [Ladona fulva]
MEDDDDTWIPVQHERGPRKPKPKDGSHSGAPSSSGAISGPDHQTALGGSGGGKLMPPLLFPGPPHAMGLTHPHHHHGPRPHHAHHPHHPSVPLAPVPLPPHAHPAPPQLLPGGVGGSPGLAMASAAAGRQPTQPSGVVELRGVEEAEAAGTGGGVFGGAAVAAAAAAAAAAAGTGGMAPLFVGQPPHPELLHLLMSAEKCQPTETNETERLSERLCLSAFLIGIPSRSAENRSVALQGHWRMILSDRPLQDYAWGGKIGDAERIPSAPSHLPHRQELSPPLQQAAAVPPPLHLALSPTWEILQYNCCVVSMPVFGMNRLAESFVVPENATSFFVLVLDSM